MKIYKLLKLVGPAHIIAGLALTLFPFLSGIHQGSVDLIFGSQTSLYPTVFLLSVFGPTLASWGVLFTVVVNQYFRIPSQYTWNALVISVLIWVILDTSLCLYYKIYLGVGLNLVAVTVVFVMLLNAKNIFNENKLHN